MHTVTLELEQLVDLFTKMYEQGMSDFEDGIFIDSIIIAKRAVGKQVVKKPYVDAEELCKHEEDLSQSAFLE
jgi:hypothetical protein